MAVLAALTLAACGGDDEEAAPAGDEQPAASAPAEPMPVEPDGGTGAGAEDPTGPPPLKPAQLTDIVGRFLTSGDPELVCDELVTDRLLREAYGDRSGCAAAQVPGSVADRVRFDEIEIGERSATAIATPRGGVSDGIELDVGLVATEDGWRIDSLDADVPVGP